MHLSYIGYPSISLNRIVLSGSLWPIQVSVSIEVELYLEIIFKQGCVQIILVQCIFHKIVQLSYSFVQAGYK